MVFPIQVEYTFMLQRSLIWNIGDGLLKMIIDLARSYLIMILPSLFVVL